MEKWQENIIKKETEDLREEIIMYTDELLKLAIDKGEKSAETESETETETETNIKALERMYKRMTGEPDIFLQGIVLLYASAPARANKRMKQYFSSVQKIPSWEMQLEQCYAMLNVMNHNSGSELSALCSV